MLCKNITINVVLFKEMFPWKFDGDREFVYAQQRKSSKRIKI
jgi:hypothetical protein